MKQEENSAATRITGERTIRREWSRLSTELPVHMHTLSGYQPSVMLDLSLTGMKIRFSRECHFGGDLRHGSGAELGWNGMEAFGELVWIVPLKSSYNAGIRFDEPLKPAILYATRNLHDEFWHAGGFKTAERQVARRWVEGLCS